MFKIQLTILLQIFCEFMTDSEVKFISIKGPDRKLLSKMAKYIRNDIFFFWGGGGGGGGGGGNN